MPPGADPGLESRSSGPVIAMLAGEAASGALVAAEERALWGRLGL